MLKVSRLLDHDTAMHTTTYNLLPGLAWGGYQCIRFTQCPCTRGYRYIFHPSTSKYTLPTYLINPPPKKKNARSPTEDWDLNAKSSITYIICKLYIYIEETDQQRWHLGLLWLITLLTYHTIPATNGHHEILISILFISHVFLQLQHIHTHTHT